ncbi:VOC family protein [Alicyclobacillus sp. SO9]|uniref:VOC family protein n=1 Tax=Alicyclobacillus sp. SO9 TaxID=2665646 RepID=UPI0018E74F87|nr:VOC family protein [Alicyclobacillus sp. SO9]QQE79816.1 VOC family protein [Alicyclobacillus sp. SO9]
MSFQFTGIHHVQLAAPEGCENTARQFFGELLGWSEVPKPKNLQKRGGVWFQCGAQQVHIGVQQDFIPAKKAHPAFLVEDLDALCRHLDQKNVFIINDEPLPGAKRFYLKDPFGNRLEFLEWE